MAFGSDLPGATEVRAVARNPSNRYAKSPGDEQHSSVYKKTPSAPATASTLNTSNGDVPRTASAGPNVAAGGFVTTYRSLLFPPLAQKTYRVPAPVPSI